MLMQEQQLFTLDFALESEPLELPLVRWLYLKLPKTYLASHWVPVARIEISTGSCIRTSGVICRCCLQGV